MLFALCIAGCSVPNLDAPQCIDARDAAKQFYSIYIDPDFLTHPEDKARVEKYLSPTYVPDPARRDLDPYTLSADRPKTFKIATCKAIDPDKVDIEVQLYWHDDYKTVQKEIQVESVKSGDAWLISKISN